MFHASVSEHVKPMSAVVHSLLNEIFCFYQT